MNLSKIDQRLLTSAISGKRSASELSQAVGGFLPPEDALLRLKQLLSPDANPLDDLEERRLLILDARRVMGILNDSIEDGDLDSMNTYIKYLKLLGDRLDKSMLSLDQMTMKLTADLGDKMSAAITAAFDAMPLALDARGVEIEMTEIEGVFQEVLPLAVSKIEAQTERD